jgi:hypothetical protein
MRKLSLELKLYRVFFKKNNQKSCFLVLKNLDVVGDVFLQVRKISIQNTFTLAYTKNDKF